MRYIHIITQYGIDTYVQYSSSGERNEKQYFVGRLIVLKHEHFPLGQLLTAASVKRYNMQLLCYSGQLLEQYTPKSLTTTCKHAYIKSISKKIKIL